MTTPRLRPEGLEHAPPDLPTLHRHLNARRRAHGLQPMRAYSDGLGHSHDATTRDLRTLAQLTPADLERARELVAQGASVRRLVLALECTRAAAWRLVKRFRAPGASVVRDASTGQWRLTYEPSAEVAPEPVAEAEPTEPPSAPASGADAYEPKAAGALEPADEPAEPAPMTPEVRAYYEAECRRLGVEP